MALVLAMALVLVKDAVVVTAEVEVAAIGQYHLQTQVLMFALPWLSSVLVSHHGYWCSQL